MNILHILPSAFPGGSELCAFETIQILEADGCKNFVVVPNNGFFVPRLSKAVSGLFIVENNWWISNPSFPFLLKIKMVYGYLKSAFKINKLIKNNKIDLVITHTMSIPAGAVAAYLKRVPHIWYIHEYGDIDHHLNFNYGKRTTLSIINLLSNKIIVNSKALFTHFLPYFSKDKMMQVNYVVDYPASNPASYKESTSLSVCMVGRIAQGKNQLIALQALTILKGLHVFPQIIFVGSIEQTYFLVLEEFIKINGLTEQVTFVGHSDSPWTHLQKADCVLVCSKNEAFGRVTVEAMKSGRIVVVSNTGAGKELVKHGETGFLFNPENAPELADILHQLWFMQKVEHITQPAHTFANENFNSFVHSKALKSLISQCL